MKIILTGFIAWFFAQFIKIILNYKKYKRLDFKLLMTSGGMPSSHTALIISATVKVAMLEGIYSSLFGVCAIVSLIVMYDAIGVRQSVGIQAKLLNDITKQLDKSLAIENKEIKEVYGHNLLEVIAGMGLGIVVGLIF